MPFGAMPNCPWTTSKNPSPIIRTREVFGGPGAAKVESPAECAAPPRATFCAEGDPTIFLSTASRTSAICFRRGYHQ